MAKRPGRPALDPADRSVTVSLALPARTFDQLYRQAQLERVSVPEVIRQQLRKPGITKT